MINIFGLALKEVPWIRVHNFRFTTGSDEFRHAQRTSADVWTWSVWNKNKLSLVSLFKMKLIWLNNYWNCVTEATQFCITADSRHIVIPLNSCIWEMSGWTKRRYWNCKLKLYCEEWTTSYKKYYREFIYFAGRIKWMSTNFCCCQIYYGQKRNNENWTFIAHLCWPNR